MIFIWKSEGIIFYVIYFYKVGPGGVAISFPSAEAFVGPQGVSVSRPLAVSQAGFGGVAIAGGQSLATAGVLEDDKNQVFLTLKLFGKKCSINHPAYLHFNYTNESNPSVFSFDNI